jgi:hypothetical protein
VTPAPIVELVTAKDLGVPAEDDPRLDDDVLLEHHRVVDAGARLHGCPGDAPSARDAGVQRDLGLHQLLPVVYADQDLGAGVDSNGAATSGRAVRNDVGQIELLLSVVRLEGAESLAQHREGRGEDARVDLAHSALVVGAEVLLLADLDDVPRGVAENASVTGRLGDLARGHREGDVGRGGSRRGECFENGEEIAGNEEGYVAIEHEGYVRRSADRGEPGERGVTRPPL